MLTSKYCLIHLEVISQFHEALPATEKGDVAVHKSARNYLRANKRALRKVKKSATPADQQSSSGTTGTSVAVGAGTFAFIERFEYEVNIQDFLPVL